MRVNQEQLSSSPFVELNGFTDEEQAVITLWLKGVASFIDGKDFTHISPHFSEQMLQKLQNPSKKFQSFFFWTARFLYHFWVLPD